MPKVIIEIGKGANADQILASLKSQLGNLADSVTLVSENTKRLEKEQRKAEGAYKSVASALDPAIRKTLEYERSQKVLDEALKRNIISETEHARLLGLSKARYQEAATASVSFAQRSQNAIGGLLGTLGKMQFLIGGLGALAGGLGLGAAIEEAREARRELALLDAQMANLPATSSITAEAVKQHAGEIGAAFAFDAEEVIRAERGLIRYGVTSEQVLRQASELSADVARSLGIGLTEAAAMVGKALQEPGEGMKALKAAGLGLSDQQIELAKHLADTGQASEAQRQVISSLRSEVEGAAGAYRDTFDGALDASRIAVGDLAEGIGNQLLPQLADLLNALTGIGGSSAAAQTLQNIASALGGILGLGSNVIEILDRIGSLGGGKVGEAFTNFLPIKVFGDWLSLVNARLEDVGVSADRAAPAISAVSEASRIAAERDKANAAATERTIKLTDDFRAALGRWTTGAIAANVEGERQAQALQNLLDTLEPIDAVYRKLAEDEADLKGYFEAANVPIERQNELLATLRERAAAAAGAAGGLAAQEIPLIPVMSPEARAALIGQIETPVEIPATLTIEGGGTQLDADLAEAADRFAQNTEAGLLSAGETFVMDLAMKSDDAWEDLGENLTRVLLQSVAEWLVAQLAAIDTAAISAKAIQGGTGASGGGGGWMSALGSMFGGGGGGGGAMAGMGAIAAWVGIAAAAVAVLKHQADREDAQRYNTSVRINTYDGGGSSSFMGGKLQETGAKVEAAFNELLSRMQQATGSFVEGMHSASIAIQNNKEEFQAEVDGVLIGVFKTAEEAMVAAMKALFSSENLSRQIDPLVQQVIDNFDASKGPDALIEAVNSVNSIVDSLSGLSEIEMAIRDLPGQAQQLAAHLHGLGVSMADAQDAANAYTVQQLQSLRDQIVGREQTQAELLAQKQREAALWNAEKALRLADLNAQLLELEAKAELYRAKVELDTSFLIAGKDTLEREADLYSMDLRIHANYVGGLAAITEKMAAITDLIGAIAAMPDIDMGEIRLPGRRGGGGGGNFNVDTGPTEAEQRIQSFLDFLESAQLAGLTEYERRLAEIDRTFAEHSQTLEEMRAASDGSAESLALLAEQEAELAAWRAEQAAALREEIIDGFGSPLEAVRDRISEIQQRVDDWFASGQDLVEQFERGEIGMDELMAALERANQLWAEFGQVAQMEIMNLALYFSDAMGDTEESARIRAELAEMEWDFKRAELRMLAEAYHAAGMLNDEEYERWSSFIDNLPDNRPPAPEQEDPNQGGGYDNGQDDALEAQRDLIAALEDLADLQRDLWASNLSPLNAEEQAQFLQGQLQDAYNQAQASGSAEDVRAFQDLVRDYLSSYQDAYGSTGGYTAEFLRINDLINNLLAMGNIGGVVPGPGMLGGTAGTGSGGWRPTPGASGTVLPFERSGGPSSPLVVESPALTAIADLTRESNRRLEALERRIVMLTAETERGNQQAASRAFLNRSTDGMVGYSGTPRISRRGA